MSEKVKETEQEKEQEVVMTVYLPISIHRVIKAYGGRIGAERQTDYTVSQAYSEALKEFAKSLAI
jgi:hypothetical protein